MSTGIEIGTEHRSATVRLPRRHSYIMISDEELTVLATGSTSAMTNLFWGTLGLFLGSIVPAVAAAGNMGSAAWGWADLLALLVAAMSLVACAICGWFGLRSKSPAQQLLDDLRTRPELPLGTIADLTYP